MKNTSNSVNTLHVEVNDTIDAIVNSINAGSMIIFCGAGISRDSGLPIVNGFVTHVLLTLCTTSKEINSIEAELKEIIDDQQRHKRLDQIVAERMNVSPEVINRIIYTLPFEAFIETLQNSTAIDEILQIYDSDSYTPEVKPNANHMLLAKLAIAGKVKTIVTTNFDKLIENAIKKTLVQQHKHDSFDYDVIYRENDFKNIDWALDRCRLIKIHGSIDDPRAMAATLSSVAKKELSAARGEIIRHVFNSTLAICWPQKAR